MNFQKPRPEEVPEESCRHRKAGSCSKALGDLAQVINYSRGFKGRRRWGGTQRTGAHKTSISRINQDVYIQANLQQQIWKPVSGVVNFEEYRKVGLEKKAGFYSWTFGLLILKVCNPPCGQVSNFEFNVINIHIVARITTLLKAHLSKDT